jgi:amino acid adenylation domain-containing protein
VDIGAAKFDLTVSAAEVDGGFRIAVEYRSDAFTEATIARLVEHFGVLLASAVAAPATPVAALDLLSDAERSQVLQTWNDTAKPYDESKTLVELIARQMAATPKAIAVEDERTSLTFKQLDVAATALAVKLGDLGVGPNVLVGICADRSVELVVGLLAILKAGAAYVPLDPEYPRERLEFMLQDAGVSVLIAQPAAIKNLTVGSTTTVSLDGVNTPSPVQIILLPPSPDDAAYMIYTSGSTGRPKGAMNAHRGIVNRLRWMQEQYQLTPKDVVLQKTPFSFDVSVWEFFWPLITGAKLVMAKPGGHRDAAYLVDAITSRGVTVCHFVPSMLRAFLADGGASTCTSLRDVMASGEALTPDLVASFYQTLPGARLHNLYGPTECAVDVTYWPCPPSTVPPALVPIGRPVSNTQMYVLDSRHAPTPIGVPGELFIGGVQVGMGYHNRPELTDERFVPDPYRTGGRLYRTGDKARWRADGTIEYLGRLDFQVKIRGFRIELGEIEATLAKHPDVREAVVVARPLVAGGDVQLVGYYVARHPERASSHPEPYVADAPQGRLREGSATPAVPASALRDHLRATLPDYMVPAMFVALASMPLGTSGKIDRRALPAPTVEETPEQFVAPRSDIETVVAALWRDVLGRERVGVETSFFDLGGHSLLATRIAGQVTKIFRTPLPLRRFFEAPTVAGVARVLVEGEAKPGQTATIARLFIKAQQMTPEERERLRREKSRSDQSTTGTT